METGFGISIRGGDCTDPLKVRDVCNRQLATSVRTLQNRQATPLNCLKNQYIGLALWISIYFPKSDTGGRVVIVLCGALDGALGTKYHHDLIFEPLRRYSELLLFSYSDLMRPKWHGP